MKAVLIGTRAYRGTGQDIDLICDQEFADKLSGCGRFEGIKGTVNYIEGQLEATVPHIGTSYALLFNDTLVYAPKTRVIDVPTVGEVEVHVASVPTLLALKKAHLILPRKWKHHISEYGKLKDLWFESDKAIFSPRKEGEAINDLYKLHRSECLAVAKAHPVLMNKKEDFFGSTNEEVEKEYEIFDHDTIHKAIALGDVPAYVHMLDGEVWCSRKKWRKMSSEQRFNCVVEESAILALERSIIPSLYLGKPFRGAKWAYEIALFKICTTITSGWFRDYCIERYWEAVDRRPDFTKSFFDGLKNGIIKAVNHEVVNGH